MGCVLDDRLADDPHSDGVHGERCSDKIPLDAVKLSVVFIRILSSIWLSGNDISPLSEWVSHHSTA
jgi:hypothetical protein